MGHRTKKNDVKHRGESHLQPTYAITADESKIAALAYRLWQERGCPEGSPEVDWFEAERLLQSNTRTVSTAA